MDDPVLPALLGFGIPVAIVLTIAIVHSVRNPGRRSRGDSGTGDAGGGPYVDTGRHHDPDGGLFGGDGGDSGGGDGGGDGGGGGD